MIDVVDPNSRWRFSQPLMEMYHHRKRVFVDRMGWQLPAAGSWLEIDEFDHDFAVYLLVRDPTDGSHLGSVRLLPSTQRHMLATTFADLCPGGAPVGEDVWEISRLVTNPLKASGAMSVRIHRMLAGGLADFARLNTVSRYTLVAELARVPALLAIGWPVTPLSLPTEHENEIIQALQIEMNEETISRMERRTGTVAYRLTPELEGRVAA